MTNAAVIVTRCKSDQRRNLFATETADFGECAQDRDRALGLLRLTLATRSSRLATSRCGKGLPRRGARSRFSIFCKPAIYVAGEQVPARLALGLTTRQGFTDVIDAGQIC